MFNENQKQFVSLVENHFGADAIISRSEIKKLSTENNLSLPRWLLKDEYKVARGKFKVPNLSQPQMAVVSMKQPKLVDDSDVSIPEKYPDYVPFGFFKNLKNIVNSKQFYPVFVTGLSGNGKTLMIEQVCAELKRECIRVNISIETDESDLLGGPTLVNGNVVNRDGPVIIAMKRGAVLLIDEVDRGSNKLMCLQGILEGKPYFNKKSGEMVYPSEGFNVVATANTKGRGSDEGKYLSQILDDAFLERFPITVEQEFPTVSVEKKILSPLIKDEVFLDNLIKWADVIRKTYLEGGIDELISTRRLVHIAKAYSIFGDKQQAIELCVNRFDEDTKMSFIDLYTKIDAGEDATKVQAPAEAEEVPF
jgi:cobaltochelatase CobS